MIPQLSHPRLKHWLQSKYPKPQLDPEWLNDCSEWLYNDRGLSPDSDFQAFITQFECQLLSSDLRDSMLHGTGLPTHIARSTTNTVLTGPPILVEIASVTEIAHGAFNLEQIRIAREERERLGGFTENNDTEGDVDVDEGPPPKFPRGMLKFELTDGATSLSAVEYHYLPEITLGVTPLGFKLNNVKIRNGIAWLEPETVIMKKYATKDREIRQKFDFARGLRLRMRLPPEAVSTLVGNSKATMRSPLQDIVLPTLAPPHNDDGVLEDRRRRIPTVTPTQNATQAPPDSRATDSNTPIAATTSTMSSHFSFTVPRAGNQVERAEDYTTVRSPIIEMTRYDSDEQLMTTQHTNPKIIHPSDKRQAPRRRARLADTKGKGKLIELHDDEEDFDEKFVMDDAFLESLNRVELEAMQSIGTSRELRPTLPPRTAGPVPSYNNPAYKPTAQNIVEIMDDEECEDKENMPVATRHVRRRTNTGIQDVGLASMSGDVIDLSD